MKPFIPFIGIAFLFFLSCNPPDTPEPVIQKIIPPSAAPGSDFTIVGHNLNYVNGVNLNTYSLQFAVPDNDTLIAKVPSDIPLGSYFLYATFEEGKSNDLPFEVIKAKPIIEKIYPPSAYANDTLEITGKYLEGNELEVHIADLVIKQFSGVTDTLILLKVTEGFKNGELTVVNSNGQSNSKYFNFLGDTPDETDYGPVYLSIYPDQGIPGGKIRITGKNFKRENLHIVFPLQIELLENAGFLVLSDTLLEITIPDEGLTGAISIENDFGRVYCNIEVVPAPVITSILPAGNRAGGPMLIYGRNLKNVKSLRFGGNPLIKQFNYFTTNENKEIITLQVPVITPGIMEVRAEINEVMFSNPVLYNLFPGSMSLPEYMPSIVIPNTPFASIADGINNQWIIMNKPSRLSLSLDFQDRTLILGNEDTVGRVNVDDNSIILNNAYGKLDKSYYTPEKDISRLIMTPLDSGNQYEMITPFYLESLEPLTLSPGDSLSVKARYFLTDDFWSVSIYDNNTYFISMEQEDTSVRVISINLIKIRLPDNIQPGEYILQVNTAGDSNTKKFTIVSK